MEHSRSKLPAMLAVLFCIALLAGVGVLLWKTLPEKQKPEQAETIQTDGVFSNEPTTVEPEREAPYVRPFIGWIEQKLREGDTDALLEYRKQAPFAQRAHPTDEHLLPLFFALGAAGDGALAQRIDAGIDLGFLAMDIYRFDSAATVTSR